MYAKITHKNYDEIFECEQIRIHDDKIIEIITKEKNGMNGENIRKINLCNEDNFNNKLFIMNENGKTIDFFSFSN